MTECTECEEDVIATYSFKWKGKRRDLCEKCYRPCFTDPKIRNSKDLTSVPSWKES